MMSRASKWPPTYFNMKIRPHAHMRVGAALGLLVLHAGAPGARGFEIRSHTRGWTQVHHPRVARGAGLRATLLSGTSMDFGDVGEVGTGEAPEFMDFSALQRVTESPMFGAVCGTEGVLWAATGAVAVCAGAQGQLEMQEASVHAFQVMTALHIVSAVASGWVASSKGYAPWGAAVKGMLCGGLALVKSAVEDPREVRELDDTYPLAVDLTSDTLRLRARHGAVMTTIQIEAIKGREHLVQKRLHAFLRAAKTNGEQQRLTSSCTVQRDAQEKNCFTLYQRFPSYECLQDHQKSPEFQELMEHIRDDLQRPLGIYMVRNDEGGLSEPRYPYGPGGEGGRDDAIYSSPANTDGSLTNFGDDA